MTDVPRLASELWPNAPAGAGAPTRYSAPTRVEDAVAILRDDPGARLIAGGQSLMPPLQWGQLSATHLVDIRNIAALRGIEIHADHIRIGGAGRFSDPLRDRAATLLPGLAAALRHVGTVTIRNRATFGGSLAWGNPRAEAALALMVHDATVVTDRREIAVADLPSGAFVTRLERDEIIVAVRVPLVPDPRDIRFRELLDRHSAGKAVVSVALRADGDSVRFAVGGLYSRPAVAIAPRDGMDAALDRLGWDYPALPDAYHSFPYRRAMAIVLLRRALSGS